VDPKQKFPVSVSVSVGFPKIAYDNGTAVFTMNGADGQGVKQIAASGTEPNWQPKGNLIAYVSGGKIIEVNPALGVTSARSLTAGPDDRRPVFSPDGKVVAFIRAVSGGDQDLCFVPTIGGTPSCLTDPTISVDRPTWSPDGKAILTVAFEKTNPTQLELFLYTTAQPFAAQAALWVPQGLQAKPKRPGDDILYAAWSPDNTRVALVANWGSSTPTFFKLFLAPWSASGLGQPKPVSPTVAACTVAWRQDGKEVAITQTNDCGQHGTPGVARVNPDKPQVKPLQQLNAENPAWQFFPNLP
jgi:Tol biopolymer transport system component